MRFLLALAVFIPGEIAGLFIFALVKKTIGPPRAGLGPVVSVLKGILERAVLVVGLLGGFSQVLIAFGALKIGTRLRADQGSEVSNNYFLVGNLVSMLLAMLYAIITKRVWGN
jgi:hypothetical protein